MSAPCFWRVLFRHIPLSDLILSVGRVCTDWARVQRTELSRRRTVLIFQNNKQLKDYREQQNPFGSELITRVRRDDGETAWYQLLSLKQIRFNAIRMPKKLTEEDTSFLMDIMPNVTHLSVAFVDRANINSALMTLKQLTRLTNHYTTSLESFTLDFGYNDYNYSYHSYPYELENEMDNCAIALFDSINRMGRLRHLMMKGTYPDLDYPNTRLDLSRLDTFVIHRFHHLVIDLTLRDTPERANVRVASGTLLKLDLALAFTPQLARNCVRFTVFDRFYSVHYADFQRFCDRFVSLTTLHVELDSYKTDQPAMTLWARCLSRLPQLIHLSFKAVLIPEDEPHPQQPLVPVTTVRLLSLDLIHTRSHLHTERLHLHEIFPNLQVLDFDHLIDECDECGCRRHGVYSTDDRVMSDRIRAIHNCMRLARQPFKRCANLHTIRLNGSLITKDHDQL